MKQTTADRLIRMALLLGSAAAFTHELFKAFLIPPAFTAALCPLLGLDTAVLLPLALCVRGRKSLYVSLFAWIAAGGALIAYALFHLTDILSSPQTLLYPRLFYLVAVPVAVLGFYAVRTRAGILFWAAGGLIGITYLAAGGYAVDIRAVALFCLFCAALFLETQLPPFPHRLRRLGTLAGFLGAMFLVTLAVLTGLGQIPTVRDMQRLQSSGLADLFEGGLSGFADNTAVKQLGGPLYPNDTPVFSVTGTSPFYLKGRTYTTYNNGTWTVDKTQDASAFSSFEALHSMLGYSFVSGSTRFRPYEPLPGRGSMFLRALTVRLLQGGYHTLFLPLGSMQWQSGTVGAPLFQNGSYRSTSALRTGDAYTLEYPYMDTQSAVFSSLETDYNQRTAQFLENLRPSRPASYSALMQESTAAYAADIALPASVSKRTRALAKALTQSSSNALEASDAIRTWLAKNCRYRTDVSAAPAGSEFVDDFLFRSREGYCVHFATAMTVLLRAAGYPARYVEGYVSPPGAYGNGTHIVTNNQSHAWVEVYTQLLGYVTEDPTPGIGPTASGSGTSSAQSAQSSAAASAVSASSILPSAAAPSAAASIPSAGKTGVAAKAAVPGWTVAMAVLAVFALAVAVRLAGRAIWFTCLRQKSRNTQVISLYLYCLRFFARLGCPCGASETPQRYACEVERLLGIAGFADVTKLYLKARYSGETVDGESCRKMTAFCHALPQKARASKGWAAALFAVLTA